MLYLKDRQYLTFKKQHTYTNHGQIKTVIENAILHSAINRTTLKARISLYRNIISVGGRLKFGSR